MTNMTGNNLSIFSHPGKITGYWITTRSFPYRGPYCPGQYGPRLRLRPIWVSLFQMLEVCNKQFNTWAFPYWPGYHPSTHIGPRLRLGMINRPIWKCPHVLKCLYFSLTWHHLDYVIYVECIENRQDIAEILLKVALNTITVENVDLSIVQYFSMQI